MLSVMSMQDLMKVSQPDGLKAVRCCVGDRAGWRVLGGAPELLKGWFRL